MPACSDEPERRWYGWQIILTDGAALASVLASADSSGWGDLALALYLGGGPVVHFAHQNMAKGVGSLALRVLAPLGGALMGALVGAMAEGNGGSGQTSPALEGAGLGVVGGLFAASIVDVAVFAYVAVPSGSRAGSGSEPPRLRLSPVAALRRDPIGHFAPTLGLSGSF